MKLNPISGRGMRKIAEKTGFTKVRQAGSHVGLFVAMVVRQSFQCMAMKCQGEVWLMGFSSKSNYLEKITKDMD